MTSQDLIDFVTANSSDRPILILTIGPSRCGKSTAVKELKSVLTDLSLSNEMFNFSKWSFFESDVVREEFTRTRYNATPQFTRFENNDFWKHMWSTIASKLSNNVSVVLDATNLDRNVPLSIKEGFVEHVPDFMVLLWVFPIPDLKILEERNKKSGKGVPTEVLKKHLYAAEQFRSRTQFTWIDTFADVVFMDAK